LPHQCASVAVWDRRFWKRRPRFRRSHWQKSGFQLWQILPLNPLGYGHSPYQPFSSFAIEELYVDLNALCRKGLCKPEPPTSNREAPKVDYEAIRVFKEPYPQRSLPNEMKKESGLPLIISSRLITWVMAWSLFMMNKRRNGMASWEKWPKEQQEMILESRSAIQEEEAPATRSGFRRRSMKSGHSSKTTPISEWESASLATFLSMSDSILAMFGRIKIPSYWIRRRKEPLWIAGVPPDYFSKTGQRWGNPIYNWDLLEKRDFSFIINRFKLNGELYDVIRLDHFRAFDTYWKIPASCPTAVEGAWIEAPGYKLFDIFFKKVTNLRSSPKIWAISVRKSSFCAITITFPGMNVVEFTFHDAEITKNPATTVRTWSLISALMITIRSRAISRSCERRTSGWIKSPRCQKKHRRG
jgi:4-alpha-glucanotransferase